MKREFGTLIGKACCLVLLAMLPAGTPAHAALTQAQLATVAARPAPDASVPAEAALTDQHGQTRSMGAWIDGRPALLVVADYRCTQVCGPMLSVAARSLDAAGLAATSDFNLLVIDFNPAANQTDGWAMRHAELGLYPELESAARFLTGTAAVISALEHSLGYSAVEDRDAGRFAHPTTLFVLTPEGRVSRMLDGLALDGNSVRLALVEAGKGRIGSLADRLHVLCYGLDPGSGAYGGAVMLALQTGAGLTLLGTVALLALSRRRSRPA